MDCVASVRLTLCISAKIGNVQLEMLSKILQAGYVLEVNVGRVRIAVIISKTRK